MLGQANAIVVVPAGTPPLRGGKVLTALRLVLPENREAPPPEPARVPAAGKVSAAPVPAVCLVGASDAGKTTAAAALIARLRARGGRRRVLLAGPGELAVRWRCPGGELPAERLVPWLAAGWVALSGRPPTWCC